ncbi:MAG: CoA pyrophosphatase [candidate division WOR-3 bacterium]
MSIINPIKSAVLVPILNNKELLLIKRSKNLKYHAGEIAFPGGIIENNENPIETAIREIYEELSIKRKYIKVIGLLEGVFISRTNFQIIPVLAKLNPKSLTEIRINNKEVDDILIYTIDELKALRRVIVPGYWYLFCSSKGVIWGATARIINEFLKLAL